MKTIKSAAAAERIKNLLDNSYSGAPWNWDDITPEEDHSLEKFVENMQPGQVLRYVAEKDSYILPPTGGLFRRVLLERLVRVYFPKSDFRL